MKRVTISQILSVLLSIHSARQTDSLSLSASQYGERLAIPRNKIGRVKSGPVELSTIGCGTWSWGNRILYNYDPSQDEEIYNSYKYLRLSGVSLFDTADSYGTFDLNGRAERLLGEFEKRLQMEIAEDSGSSKEDTGTSFFGNLFNPLKNSMSQKSVPPQQQVATKFAAYPWRITPSSIVSAAQESLKRLDQPKLSLAQLHWSTATYQPFQEKALWEGIADVYDANLCDAVGVSNYGPEQLLKISTYLQDRNVPLASAQIQYSLMTYQTAQYMNDICEEQNCALISYSPLCLGLLTCKYNLDNLPSNPLNPRRQLFRELLPSAQPLLNLLQVLAKEYNKTPSQIAINWTLCKNTIPIFGCRTLDQAMENVQSGAGDWNLNQDAIDMLDQCALTLEKPMIQNIFQTK